LTASLLWPDHCVQDTPGSELISELDASKLDLIIDKGKDNRVESYSAFGPPFRSPRVAMSGLDVTLRKADITHVFVCGLAWDFCVKFTAIDAAKEGFTTYVIEDATRGIDRSQDGHAKTRQDMEDAGVKVIGLVSEELEILRRR
jgi:nicotinamidase-related amidase